MRATMSSRLRGTPIRIMATAIHAWAIVKAGWMLSKKLEQSDSFPFSCIRQVFILLVIGSFYTNKQTQLLTYRITKSLC